MFSLALREQLRIEGFFEVKMQARGKWSDFYGSNKYGMVYATLILLTISMRELAMRQYFCIFAVGLPQASSGISDLPMARIFARSVLRF
jgi:hypothetical protein